MKGKFVCIFRCILSGNVEKESDEYEIKNTYSLYIHPQFNTTICTTNSHSNTSTTLA